MLLRPWDSLGWYYKDLERFGGEGEAVGILISLQGNPLRGFKGAQENARRKAREPGKDKRNEARRKARETRER